MYDLYKEVADMIFERGAFKVGEFKLKLHEKHPDAPLSPFYINLRVESNPTRPGPLTTEDCEMIASLLLYKVNQMGLVFDSLAGLPHAADPFMEAVPKVLRKMGSLTEIPIVPLAKEVTKNGRRIIPQPGYDYKKGEIVLLFDDLITGGDSKIEAIKAVESGGAVVKNIVVLLDRVQGGGQKLAEAGYTLYSCFHIIELLNYYYESSYIDLATHRKCKDYLKS